MTMEKNETATESPAGIAKKQAVGSQKEEVYPMGRLNLNRNMFQVLAQWYLCVIFLLLLQLFGGLFWTFFGPSGNTLEHFLELAYSSPASWLGNVFFEEQMFFGNAPLGMGLTLLIVILYAILGGTVICLIYRLLSFREIAAKE